MFLSDGTRLPGYMDAATIEHELAKVKLSATASSCLPGSSCHLARSEQLVSYERAVIRGAGGPVVSLSDGGQMLANSVVDSFSDTLTPTEGQLVEGRQGRFPLPWV
jgi:hypothetical protein